MENQDACGAQRINHKVNVGYRAFKILYCSRIGTPLIEFTHLLVCEFSKVYKALIVVNVYLRLSYIHTQIVS